MFRSVIEYYSKRREFRFTLRKTIRRTISRLHEIIRPLWEIFSNFPEQITFENIRSFTYKCYFARSLVQFDKAPNLRDARPVRSLAVTPL